MTPTYIKLYLKNYIVLYFYFNLFKRYKQKKKIILNL